MITYNYFDSYIYLQNKIYKNNWEARQEKTTAIRRIAVRETGVSRPHGGPIEGPPEAPRAPQRYRVEGFKGALNYSPIMPRDARPSDPEYKFI